MVELAIPLGPFGNDKIVGDPDHYPEADMVIHVEQLDEHAWKVWTNFATLGYIHKVQRNHASNDPLDSRDAFVAIMGSCLLGAWEFPLEARNAIILAYYG